MAAKQKSIYIENKYTNDIVYSYNTGEEDRYKKTERGVVLIHKSREGKIVEQVFPDQMFPIAEFESIKILSDEDYRARNEGDVLEHRHTVSLNEIEETKICAQERSAEEECLCLLDDDDYEDFRNLHNAIVIINECLTEKQKTRFLKYYYCGKSQQEIADSEGIGQRSVSDSIKLAEKNIKKYLFNKAKNTSKNNKKLYIGEGTKKRQN